MMINEFSEMLQFAIESIQKKTDKPIKVQLIFTNKIASVLSEFKEIGFDDKSATIYIEG
jgi:hypothetical protein